MQLYLGKSRVGVLRPRGARREDFYFILPAPGVLLVAVIVAAATAAFVGLCVLQWRP